MIEEYSLPYKPNMLVFSTTSALNLKPPPIITFLLLFLNAGTPGLNSPISAQHLALIARHYLNDWEALCPHLGLSCNQETAIARSHPQDYARQRHKCLQEWRRTKGVGATYQALISAAEEAKQQFLADNVRDLINS